MVEKLHGEVIVDVHGDLEVLPVVVPLGVTGRPVIGVNANRVGQVHAMRSGLRHRIRVHVC